MRKYMSMDSETKVVQTELTPEEYERLRRVAEQEDTSLKALLREAATAYTRTHTDLDPDDPLFNYDPSGTTGEPVSATKSDDYLYDEK